VPRRRDRSVDEQRHEPIEQITVLGRQGLDGVRLIRAVVGAGEPDRHVVEAVLAEQLTEFPDGPFPHVMRIARGVH